MVLPFPECHMVEIIQYVAFSHWLLSLSSMLLRSLHVFLWLDRSFLFVKSESAQSCLTLLDPMDCSPPGSSVHGILQARILEWVAIPFSRRSSQPRDQTQVSRIYFYCWVIFHYRDEPYSSIHLGPIFLTCKGRLSSSTLDSCHQMTQVQCSAWCPASHPLYLPSPTSFTLA